MAVHSTRFAAQEAPTSATDVYTVPTGKRTIVKGFTVWNDASTFGRVNLEVKTSGGTILSYVTKAVAAKGSPGEVDNGAIWVVLNAGEKLALFASQALMYVTVSGAELTL